MTISKTLYKKYPEKKWIGRRVRSTCALKNGLNHSPTGTIFTIVGKQAGFSLQTEPCEKCGVSVYIKKVPPEDLELLTDLDSLKETG
jgi:hypothetical protein